MATETVQAGGPVTQAAANAVAPDPETAQLLAKHAAGEKLSSSEYGRLGAFKSKLNAFFRGKAAGPGPVAQPVQPGNGAGNAPGLVPMASAETSDDGLPVVLPDPRIIQRTTGAILKNVDGIARRFITREARKTGADDKTVARFDSAAAMPMATQELMVEVSPDVAAVMGIQPQHFPIGTFFGALGLWSANLWLLVDELRSMRQKNDQEAQPVAVKTGAVPAEGVKVIPGKEKTSALQERQSS